MNPVTARYLSDPALVDAVGEAEVPPAYRRYRQGNLLSRPLFVPEDDLLSCARDTIAVLDLLASLPSRVFDGDVTRYCSALGIDPVTSGLLASYHDGPPVQYGRADFYRNGSSFTMLEFNVASDLGGLDNASLHQALLGVPAFASFAAEHRLGYVDTAAAVVRSLRVASGAPDPVVALVCADVDLPAYRDLLGSVLEALSRLGLDVVLAGLGEVRTRSGRLFVGRGRVDVVLRYFTVDHVPANAPAVARILRAHTDGTCVLFTPMNSSLYSNKGALALLSDARWTSAEERALVDRVLPWTRRITPDLVDQCFQEREQLILKPARDFGGRGVVAGWETPEEAWKALLDEAVRRSHVVQRRVVPEPEPVVDVTTGEVGGWTPAWGLFVTPEGFAGTMIRAVPRGGGAVVNLGANSRARATAAFTYRE
ncbi:hypothetical protein FHX81_1543 [Saccharothrix saharensis]|uniref:Circularly permuted ATP-grasp superfamily protein n=1 Tax=Saccharothrix saharensis TaxID=571190 RepID=A0A543J8U4_9PSEU|nr:hypothetical protein [Saccharothrix saharensis]TQM79241.1 hypothetical protein FHX81_1543 [Saccharothrix saharensis]